VSPRQAPPQHLPPPLERPRHQLARRLDRLSGRQPGFRIFIRLRVVVRAEHHIPQWTQERKITIDVRRRLRMMDAVHLWRQQEAVEATEADSCVQVCEARKQDTCDCAGGGDPSRRHEQVGDRDADRESLQWSFQPVVSVGRRDIHVLVAMMHFVLGPEPRRRMLQPVEPVISEVHDERPDQGHYDDEGCRWLSLLRECDEARAWQPRHGVGEDVGDRGADENLAAEVQDRAHAIDHDVASVADLAPFRGS